MLQATLCFCRSPKSARQLHAQTLLSPAVTDSMACSPPQATTHLVGMRGFSISKLDRLAQEETASI